LFIICHLNFAPLHLTIWNQRCTNRNKCTSLVANVPNVAAVALDQTDMATFISALFLFTGDVATFDVDSSSRVPARMPVCACVYV